MEQRMRGSALRGNISIWAWAVSIIVHTVLLAGLTLVKFSPEKHRPSVRQTPAARITRIREIAHSSFIMPKPKIERQSVRPHLPVSSRLPIQPLAATPDGAVADLGCLAAKPGGTSGALPYSKISSGEAEFFGRPLDARRVCFLVDCSGSMHGVFRKVAERLKRTIMDLKADQYFYIIFFGRDRLIENGGGRLIRATEQTKSEACEFIDRTTPGGCTNVLSALERAMEIQDNRGRKPSVIFFLTDGFELLPEDNELLPEKIATIRKRLSPEVRINTIGFWAQPADCAVLEVIARESRGRFSYVEP
jgi:hypothetical protein